MSEEHKVDAAKLRGLSCMAGLLLLAALAACGAGSGDSPTAQESNGSNAPSTSTLTGLIAIGHSALTGENSDPATPGPVPANSWATGTNASVNSIYERMLAAQPEIEGHVANTAEGGATADQLTVQASDALRQVPAPQLAIIETIDNDIRCDGTDADHVAEFGDSVRSALRTIAEASPQTQVLMVSPQGSPARELKLMAPLIATNPDVRAIYSGPAPCGMIDDNGRVVPANVAALTAIIQAYAAEESHVCAEFPTCQTDGGANKSFKHEPSVVATDFNHLNTRGLAEEAALEWPVARGALASAEAG